jgi:type IV secretory pathway VirB2 component (pilin)
MTVVLIIAAAASLAPLFALDSSPARAGWSGALTWLAAIALFLAAACYLLTLATGWQP